MLCKSTYFFSIQKKKHVFFSENKAKKYKPRFLASKSLNQAQCAKKEITVTGNFHLRQIGFNANNICPMLHTLAHLRHTQADFPLS